MRRAIAALHRTDLRDDAPVATVDRDAFVVAPLVAEAQLQLEWALGAALEAIAAHRADAEAGGGAGGAWAAEGEQQREGQASQPNHSACQARPARPPGRPQRGTEAEGTQGSFTGQDRFILMPRAWCRGPKQARFWV